MSNDCSLFSYCDSLDGGGTPDSPVGSSDQGYHCDWDDDHDRWRHVHSHHSGQSFDYDDPTQPPSIFLTGRVRLEDGTPPPQSVRIERVCGTATHTEGFTDRKGDFAIQIGSAENASYQDASDTGPDGCGPCEVARRADTVADSITGQVVALWTGG